MEKCTESTSECMCLSSVTQLCQTLQPYGLKPTMLLCPRDFPGKNAGVGYQMGIKLMSPVSPALAGEILTTESPEKPSLLSNWNVIFSQSIQ